MSHPHISKQRDSGASEGRSAGGFPPPLSSSPDMLSERGGRGLVSPVLKQLVLPLMFLLLFLPMSYLLLLTLLFYFNVSGMRLRAHLSFQPLTIPPPWVIYRVGWSHQSDSTLGPASRFLAGNMEAELKPTNHSHHFYFSIFFYLSSSLQVSYF